MFLNQTQKNNDIHKTKSKNKYAISSQLINLNFNLNPRHLSKKIPLKLTAEFIWNILLNLLRFCYVLFSQQPDPNYEPKLISKQYLLPFKAVFDHQWQ